MFDVCGSHIGAVGSNTSAARVFFCRQGIWGVVLWIKQAYRRSVPNTKWTSGRIHCRTCNSPFRNSDLALAIAAPHPLTCDRATPHAPVPGAITAIPLKCDSKIYFG
ncbi:hypothetical protein AVEN_269039-1 [Araneus ventricosus]|uniref:Uncharacterized protein n=1 Tax=Araneus ventricosus TaxID=182803 RepID=A0A4Y2LBS9_ARAVE|nr:hypothetical protein AVEN_269039-1 [Araneus ventricosus]